MASTSSGIGFGGVAIRIVGAVALVLATINPTQWSFLRWAFAGIEQFTPVKAIVGILLLAAWVVYLRAALDALGLIGLVLSTSLVGAFIWLAVRNGWLELGNTSTLMWVVLIAIGVILGIGISWAHLKRGLTGQVDIDR
jgi:hypothetical protein